MSGCEGYEAIARAYDKLNADIDYCEWATFIEKCFDRFLSKSPELVLDLACGTGRMTRELASRGYDMIGVDGSADMLSRAMEEESEGILYLCQDMREFELYGTVGAAVCCLDSVNYLLERDDLEKAFSLVHNYLDPDGLFVFDVNSPHKFENVYADNAYVLEDELDMGDGETGLIYCGWQNEYDRESRICDFYLTLFEELEDGSYARSDEHQRERCYTKEELEAALEKTGMELVGVYSDFEFNTPTDTDDRWYIVARAKK
ncbi:MAG: methyltransferase domain-containing protein [Ruminococcaceae bacterium]|nr:methyltransferase domain-containing protein [Oscillospiraceae bacterium]